MSTSSDQPPGQENSRDFTAHVERFESAWKSGRPVNIADYLPPVGGAGRREVLVELIMVDMECRWKPVPVADPPPDGSSPIPRKVLDDYASEFPELGPLAELPAELIGEEYRVRVRWGERPASLVFLARFSPREREIAEVVQEIEAALERERNSEVANLSHGDDSTRLARRRTERTQAGAAALERTLTLAGPRPIVGDSGLPRTSIELQEVLRRRLCAVLPTSAVIWIVICIGSLTEVSPLVRREVAGGRTQVLSAATTLLFVGSAILVWTRPRISLPLLRGISFATLLTTGICLASYRVNGMHHALQTSWGRDTTKYLLSAVALLDGFGWMSLILVHGLVLPNTQRSILGLMAGIAACPLVIDLGLSMASPRYFSELAQPMVLTTLLLGAALAIAWFGSYKLTLLEKQVQDARREASNARALGPYILGELLGSGGMGEVYVAEHRLLKRPCAVKLIRQDRASDARLLARFDREVRATARLKHPNTIEVFDYGRAEDGTFYYVMEFLDGMPLDELVARHGRLSPGRVARIVRQVCGALQEAHGKGLIHRDIKPQNVFLCRHGGLFDFVKLLDFGLVRQPKVVDPHGPTSDGEFVGTPTYASPEQIRGGELDLRSDLYSLGATMFFLLCGRPPFTGGNAIDVWHDHCHSEPPSLASLGLTDCDDLNAILRRCLAKNAADRFASARDLEEAIGNCRNLGEWTENDARNWWETHGDAESPREDS